MWQFLGTLISQVATPAIVIAALTYLCQRIFSQFMARDIEGFKSKQILELEQFKRNLDVIQFERQTRFTSLHQKRGELFASLYTKIVEADRLVRQMTSPMQFAHPDREKEEQRKADQRKTAIEAYNSAREFFENNRLFLGKNASTKTNELFNIMHSGIVDFDVAQGRFGGGSTDHRQWVEAWKKVSVEVPSVLAEIEREFHAILGIAD